MRSAQISRRKFLHTGAVVASTAAIAGCVPIPAGMTPPPTPTPPVLPYRVLGKTGWQLSVVGFGGIVVMNETTESAAQLVAEAIRRGINYFDVAPSYGNAEERLGPALEPYRTQVFLACKTAERSREGAERELRRSLERLRTDHFDLYQFHAVKSLAEVEAIMGKGGALEAFLDARERGQIKHIGFSAHDEQAALVLLDRFQFDTILYPVNWVCWYGGNFGPRVVSAAVERGMGILALKALARQTWPSGAPRKWPKCWYEPVDTPAEAELGLRFTLSKPVTAAVPPGHAELLWLACAAAERFVPLSAEEEAALRQKAGELRPIFAA